MNTPTAPALVLSHFQAADLLKGRQDGAASAVTSPDLGLTFTEVRLTHAGAFFADGTTLPWKRIEEIQSNENACYRIVDNVPTPIRGYSQELGRSHSLLPTATAPALFIAGFPMHRVKGTDPRSAALAMVKAIAPVRGHVLDTATGLGYTAIEAAKTADHVTTIELDPVAQDMARLNPWSRELFDNPTITQVMGDSLEVIQTFAPGTFSCIMHDPPTVSLAGDLYSGEFYRHACRVLKSNGRMFHYVGDPETRSGASTTKGVVKRLKEAGFGKVEQDGKAHGVVAWR